MWGGEIGAKCVERGVVSLRPNNQRVRERCRGVEVGNQPNARPTCEREKPAKSQECVVCVGWGNEFNPEWGMNNDT